METEEIRIVFLTNEELREALDGFAKKNQLSRSDVVRMALKKFLYDGTGDPHLVR
jgi:metal-responsive CopG/Arc/MetJ family transcriptional regulator